ncbi:MAG: GntR family transcriptional regulator [Terracoccus sp.]
MKWNVDSTSNQPLHEQIAANIRRAVADGSILADERLPPARELGGVLGVDPNTVLAAYRQLRVEGLLDFRRGRAVRVRADSAALASVTDLARQLHDLGLRHGYSSRDLAALLTAMGEPRP